MSDDTLRAFVAVQLEGPARAALKAAVADLRALNADVRWMPESNWHLTLKFLGEGVARARVSEFLVLLREEAAHTLVCRLQVARLEPFPPGRKPRMVAAAFADNEGAQRLVELARRIDARFDALGFPPERRAFRPHLTLGRLGGERGLKRLWDALSARYAGPLGEGVVGALHFMESELLPQGARYSELGSAPLQT